MAGNSRRWVQFRHPRVQQLRRSEEATVLDMVEAGYEPGVRAKVRANPGSRAIPTAFDDQNISALYEADAGGREWWVFRGWVE